MFIAGEANPCGKTGEKIITGPDGFSDTRFKEHLKGIQTQLTKMKIVNTNLRGKAVNELNQWKQKGLQTVEDIRSKVKEEIKQYELKEAARSHQEDDRQHHDHKSKQVVGGWVLTPQQMAFIKEKPYCYNASAGSYLELFCLQRFWLWLATFIPECIAPSVITCLGLAINMACCLNVIYFSFDLRTEAPGWTFVLCAIGVFLYQTLDALDGKQSFKVQNSPIEEVYDHGCDAVSTVFVTLAVAAATQLGFYPTLLYLFFLTSVVAFYSTHWVCHVTHTMVFGKIDVSEAQWTMIIVHGLTAYYGQRIWHTVLLDLLGVRITFVHVISIMTLLSLMRAIVDNSKMAFGQKTPLEELGIDIPRRSSVYAPLIPLGLLTIFTTACFMRGIFMESPTIFILMSGFCYAKLTMKLVMVNISRGDMEVLDSSLVVPILLAANSMFHLLNPYTALLCGLVYSIMDSLRYFTYSSWDLRVALDANIFTIKYPVGHPKNRNGDNGFYVNGLNSQKVVANWNRVKESRGSDPIWECFKPHG